MTPLLVVKNLHVGFKAGTQLHPILCGVNLEMFSGEALALVGESGSGKSVTVQSILQLLGQSAVMTQGSVTFKGEALHTKTLKEMNPIRGKKIALVPQDPMTSLNPTLSVGHQIAEMLILHEKHSRREARLGAIEMMKRVGIADAVNRYDAYPFQLSGGMRQRILIASALVCRPALLIADEPTTALDVTVQAQILDLLRELQEEMEMGLLLITHDLGVVASLCHRVAVMNGGKIVETGSVESVFHSPVHPYTQVLLSSKKSSFSWSHTPHHV